MNVRVVSVRAASVWQVGAAVVMVVLCVEQDARDVLPIVESFGDWRYPLLALAGSFLHRELSWKESSLFDML